MRRAATGLSVCLLLGLAGCATPQQISARDDQVCQSYGASPGSDAYVACRMQQQRLRVQADQEAAAAVYNGLAHMAPPPPPPSSSLDCRSTALGNTVRTHCN
jgi:hypothetical protein